MSDPARGAKFVAAFQAKFAQLEAKGEDRRAELLQKIDRAKQTISQATQDLLLVPTSQALASTLQAEERALGDLQTKLDQLQPQRAKVIPHPAAIAAFVSKLADVLEAGDLVRTEDILRSPLTPFAMVPHADRYRMTGALNVGLSDLKSSAA
jgi:hypothetical protein